MNMPKLKDFVSASMIPNWFRVLRPNPVITTVYLLLELFTNANNNSEVAYGCCCDTLEGNGNWFWGEKKTARARVRDLEE